MKHDLVVGNTSQLAQYFDNTFEIKISSRNIPEEIFKKKWRYVYLTFAEQRTYLEDKHKDLFYKTNVEYTIDLIKKFSPIAETVVVYGTIELWNNCTGPVSADMGFDYNYSHYIDSKHEMCDRIELFQHNGMFNNVMIIHPANFNTPYRKGDYLFAKVFRSLIQKEHITIGNTYFYRDLVHPRAIVNDSRNVAAVSYISGSGRLVFVNDFIRDLYKAMDTEYSDYVTESFTEVYGVKRSIFYAGEELGAKQDYSVLLGLTILDLKHAKANYDLRRK